MTIVLIGIVALVSWCVGRISTTYTRPMPIDRLKNALLTLALSMACKKDMSGDMFYGSYDGTKLPMMSGSSLTDSCFTYILDISEFRQHPLYTPVIEAKILAIHKYIESNLNTDEKVIDFFDRFVSELGSRT